MKPRLLVVELHHLGDAVMSLPFVRGAQETFDVHILCRPATEAVYNLLPQRPCIRGWEPPWGEDQTCSAWETITAVRDQGRILRALEFGTAVCVWSDARAEILMAEAHAVRRTGFPMTRGNYYAADLPWRRQRLWSGRILEAFWRFSRAGRPLLTQRLHRESPRQPHLRCWEQIAESLGIRCDYSVPWVKVSGNSSRGGKSILAVHAHARISSKQWPKDLWRAVAESPQVRKRFDLLEILAPGTEPVTSDDVRKIATPDLASLVGALQSADAVLCHDSLPAHLAAALGKPVVAIFGSGEPDWFAPWRNRDRVVQKNVCPLHPCIDRCGMDSYLCLEAISKDDVLAQLQRLESAL